MDTSTFILMVLFIMVNILNLATLNRQSEIADILFVILCAAAGVVSLVKDYTDVTGYVPIAMAIGWGIYSFFRHKRKNKLS
ncbi:MAG: hypothetical protein HY081_06045 [Gammaproteobacteria bacterium]|nr:hypothetical protein [Gammaproteobacteria bacterium]